WEHGEWSRTCWARWLLLVVTSRRCAARTGSLRDAPPAIKGRSARDGLALDVDDPGHAAHRLHDLVQVLQVVDAHGELDGSRSIVEGPDLRVADVRLHRREHGGYGGQRPRAVLHAHGQPHLVLPLAAPLPLHGDPPLRVVDEVSHVRTALGVDGDA